MNACRVECAEEGLYVQVGRAEAICKLKEQTISFWRRVATLVTRRKKNS
jgi:hypothetical protein